MSSVRKPSATIPPVPFRRLVLSLALSIGVSFGAILFGTSVLITSEGAGSYYSITELSVGFSGSVLVGAAFAVPIGRRADTHGIREIVGLGGVLVFCGFAIFAFSTHTWQMLLGWWVLIGPGSAMVLFDPGFVALQQWFTREERNRAAGILTLLTGLAGPVFIPAVTQLNAQLGWRPTAALLGLAVLLVTSSTSYWALRAAPVRQVSPADSACALTTDTPSRQPRQLPRGFVLLTLSIALTMAVLEALNVHRLARFEAAGFDPLVLSWWAAALGLLSLPGRYLLPLLANKYNTASIWMVLTALTLPALLLAVRGSHHWEMNGHFILFGLVFGAFMPLRAVLMSDWYSGPRFGTLMGLQAVAIALGRASGPAVVAWLADSPLGYPAAMLLLSLMLVLSLLAVLLATRRA